MSSPLEEISAVRELRYDVILSRDLKKFSTVECISGDTLRLIFTIYKNPDAQGNLEDGVDIDFLMGYVPLAGTYNDVIYASDEEQENIIVEVEGSQAIITIDTEGLANTGKHYCQLRLSKDGSTITPVHGYIEIGELME